MYDVMGPPTDYDRCDYHQEQRAYLVSDRPSVLDDVVFSRPHGESGTGWWVGGHDRSLMQIQRTDM